MVPVDLQGGHTWDHQLEGMYGSWLVDPQLADPVMTALGSKKSTKVKYSQEGLACRK